MKNICILGSTGSIGQSALEVAANFPDLFHVSCLTANTNIETLERQIRRFKPRAVAVLDRNSASRLKASLDGSMGSMKLFADEDGLTEMIRGNNIDIVVSSMVGFAGLKPTIEAVKQGKTVALANKETLVVAGEIITALAKEHGARILPVDSEHSAIMQCLAGEDSSRIAKLILTASGGPFLNYPKEKFGEITVDAALNHPNWKMGKKITIDSATLMNKGLEVIEARWLFGLPPEKIEVIVHPQSIIHSMVEFIDGSVKAQMGVPDMKLPIQYALTYPERLASSYTRLDFAALKEMTFFSPDPGKFECLQLAYDALNEAGTAPAILNAANEVAVAEFLAGTVKFTDIPRIIRGTLERVPATQSPQLEDIFAADARSRQVAASL